MKNYLNIFYWSIALVCLAFYWYLLWTYSINIPYYDDYDTILWFYAKMNLIEPYHLLSYLFHQHNEHRLLFNRLVVLFSYYFIGELDLRFYIFLGNIALLGVLAIIAFVYKNEQKFSFIVAISVFFIFNLSNYETIFWAMASISNYYVIFFALLSFVLLVQDKTGYFILALVFACLSVYTQANGLNTLIAASVYLAWKVGIDRTQADKIKLGFWLVITLLIFVAYFMNYHVPIQHSGIQESFSHPLRLIGYFLAFLGAIIFEPLKAIGINETISMYGAILLGGLLVFSFLYLSYHRLCQKYPVIYLFILFLLGSAAMTSLGRSSFGIYQAFASRYTINSNILILLIITSILCMYKFKSSLKQKFNVIIFSLVMTYHIGSYIIFLPIVKVLHHEKIIGALLFAQQNISDKLSYPNPESVTNILYQLEKQKRYSISKSLDSMGFTVSPKMTSPLKGEQSTDTD